MLNSGLAIWRRSGPGNEIGPRSRTWGSGLPIAIKLRRYQNPPAAKAGRDHHRAAAHLLPSGASTSTATVRAAAIASTVNLVPAAMPTARPAAASGQPVGSDLLPCPRSPAPSRGAAQALTRIATA